MTDTIVPLAEDEVSSAKLGDVRRSRRLTSFVATMR
jgi:hypothetical protein